DAVSRNDHSSGIVYLQITRGVAPRTHYFPADTQPTVFVYAAPYAFDGFEKKLVNVVVTEDFRWHRCDIKSISLMANVLANEEAHQLEVAENIFHRGEYLTEGSHTSVFFVRDGVLFTHPEGGHILPGITRAVVLDIAKKLGVEVREEAVSLRELQWVSEAFLTGTTAQVTAIGTLRHHGEILQVGDGAAGPVTKRIQQAFMERIGSVRG